MALNIFNDGIQRFRTCLCSFPLPQPFVVREEDADAYFFSKDYIVPRDLAVFILDRVSDAELARMQRVNRKWYWVVVKSSRLMDRLSMNSFISSCTNAGKADIEKLRQKMRQLGWFSIPAARSAYLIQIARATLAIAKVDPRYLEIAKVAAFEVEDPPDAAYISDRAYAIKNVAEEEALRDIEAAKLTALKINDSFLQAMAFRGIAEIEGHGRNNRAVAVTVTGEPLVVRPEAEVAKGITIVDRDKALLLQLKLHAERDLKGAKERALKLTRIDKTLGLVVIAEVDPKHDFSEAKSVALGLFWTFRSKLGRGNPDNYWINNLLIEIVNVEARYNLKDAKETAFVIKDPFWRVIALAIVAKAAQSRLNSLAL